MTAQEGHAKVMRHSCANSTLSTNNSGHQSNKVFGYSILTAFLFLALFGARMRRRKTSDGFLCHVIRVEILSALKIL